MLWGKRLGYSERPRQRWAVSTTRRGSYKNNVGSGTHHDAHPIHIGSNSLYLLTSIASVQFVSVENDVQKKSHLLVGTATAHTASWCSAPRSAGNCKQRCPLMCSYPCMLVKHYMQPTNYSPSNKQNHWSFAVENGSWQRFKSLEISNNKHTKLARHVRSKTKSMDNEARRLNSVLNIWQCCSIKMVKGITQNYQINCLNPPTSVDSPGDLLFNIHQTACGRDHLLQLELRMWGDHEILNGLIKDQENSIP